MTIALVPDWTIIVQFGVFCAALAVLTGGVLRPFVRVRDLRRQATVETEAAAKRLETVAAARLAEYERRLAAARQEGAGLKEALRQEGYAAAGAIIAEARTAAFARLDAAKTRITQEAGGARRLLAANAEEFARGIAERILERSLEPRRAATAAEEEEGRGVHGDS